MTHRLRQKDFIYLYSTFIPSEAPRLRTQYDTHPFPDVHYCLFFCTHLNNSLKCFHKCPSWQTEWVMTIPCQNAIVKGKYTLMLRNDDVARTSCRHAADIKKKKHWRISEEYFKFARHTWHIFGHFAPSNGTLYHDILAIRPYSPSSCMNLYKIRGHVYWSVAINWIWWYNRWRPSALNGTMYMGFTTRNITTL